MGRLAELIRALAGFFAGLALGWGTLVVGFFAYAAAANLDGQTMGALGMITMLMVGLATGVGLAALMTRRR